MEPIKIARDSWHYKLAKHGGFCEYQHADICAYDRHVIYGAFILLFLCTLLIMTTWTISYVLVDAVLGVAFSLYCQVDMLSEVSKALLVAFAVGIIVGIGMFGGKFVSRVVDAGTATVASVPYIRSAYTRFKEKYCARIEFK